MTNHESFKDYDDDAGNVSSAETLRWHMHDWNTESSKIPLTSGECKRPKNITEMVQKIVLISKMFLAKKVANIYSFLVS